MTKEQYKNTRKKKRELQKINYKDKCMTNKRKIAYIGNNHRYNDQ